jgi:hypothetical protein
MEHYGIVLECKVCHQHHSKSTLLNFNLDSVDEEPLCGNATANCYFFFFFIYFIFVLLFTLKHVTVSSGRLPNTCWSLTAFW